MAGAPYLPMLATAGPLPAVRGWAYELKWDGVRAIAVATPAGTRLYARKGHEITVAYPELAVGQPVAEEVVLDGEIVVLDAAGRPSFRDLAERMHVRDVARAARLATTMPVLFMAFDLLRVGSEDLLARPYAERRAALEALGLAAPVVVPPSFDDGQATYAASLQSNLEGIVAKRRDSVYRPGLRSPDWIKIKHEATGDFVVGGYRPGARALGALLVGVPGPDGLVFWGRVGGGISNASERQLLDTLNPLLTERSPFAGTMAREDAKGARWVRPEVVVEVRFSERTREGRLRFPRFLRLRPDKAPDEVTDAG